MLDGSKNAEKHADYGVRATWLHVNVKPYRHCPCGNTKGFSTSTEMSG